MHGTHPSFQPNAVLLNLLDRLAFGYVWCLDAKIEGKLTPCLDEFEESVNLEVLVVAFWWRLEIGP